MGGVVDDIVNPIGAITGVDPVKSATGFTGTGFEPKASSSGGTAAAPGGGGSRNSSGGAALAAVSGQMLNQQQQQVAQGNNMFSQFGDQLAQLHTQIAPPVSANPAPTQSSTDLAAQITANSVHAAQTAPPGHQPPQQNFWQTSPTMNTFR